MAENDIAIPGKAAGRNKRTARLGRASGNGGILDLLQFRWPPVTGQFKNAIVSDQFSPGSGHSRGLRAFDDAIELGEIFGINLRDEHVAGAINQIRPFHAAVMFPGDPSGSQAIGDFFSHEITVLEPALPRFAFCMEISPAGAFEAFGFSEPGLLFGGKGSG